MRKANFQRGFTLIELLVVIAIIGILAASLLILVNPVKQFAKARDTGRKNDLFQIQRALDSYYIANQRYPTTVQDFDLYDLSNRNGFIKELVDGGYLKFSLDDPLKLNSGIDCLPGHKNWSSCYIYAYSSVPGWYGVTDKNYVLLAQLENADDPMIETNSCSFYRSDMEALHIFKTVIFLLHALS